MQDLVGHGTEVMNLEGKAVVPGFIDSHVHLLLGGLQVYPINQFCSWPFVGFCCLSLYTCVKLV